MPSKKRPAEEDVEEAPTEIEPYTVLSVSRIATADEIKKAYRKAALKHHPDKASPSEKDAAHARFQEIAFAYAVLSDSQRRTRYDATGNTSETLDIGDDGEGLDWAAFFRQQFAEMVTEDKINNFAQEYKGGEEEKGHVLEAYEKSKGDMDKLYQQVMLSHPVDDDERFHGIIDQAIKDGEVEDHKKYSQETEKSRQARINKARKRREKEAKEADGMGDLAAMIQARQKARQSAAPPLELPTSKPEESHSTKDTTAGSGRSKRQKKA